MWVFSWEQAGSSHWHPSDRKSPQFSWTLLSILTDLSSSLDLPFPFPFSLRLFHELRIWLVSQSTSCIITFHMYLSSVSFSLIVTPLSVGTAKSTIYQVHFFWLTTTRQACRQVDHRWLFRSPMKITCFPLMWCELILYANSFSLALLRILLVGLFPLLHT